ncbi:hypothetical protein ACFV9D_22700 [Streptomyces sp. NPDC059875]|uniref:hypothetical protein n=1 Tax=unclassified Streptomyces TaxID=2593676 RepID=UPI00366983CD
MPRLIPMIVIAVAIYFWLKARKERKAAGIRPEASAPPALSARSATLGFLPAAQLDTKRFRPEDPALTAALDAARDGDWKPAAELLAATTAGPDWETRSFQTVRLGRLAAEDDSWLTAWETAQPDSPDAAVVRADSTVTVAGNLRGSATAKNTTQEQFDGFHRMMRQARGEIARAAELNPADPTPLIGEIWVALALGYPHDDMRALWEGITERAPHHYSAHYSALQYWCQKWRGSVELAQEFTDHAVATAPPGSLLTALPLISWYEHESFGHTDRGYAAPELPALVDALAADVSAAPAEHLRLNEARLLLAWYLVELDRHAEALEQFRLVDGYIGAFPWNYYGDPAKAYVKARERAVRKAGR